MTRPQIVGMLVLAGLGIAVSGWWRSRPDPLKWAYDRNMNKAGIMGLMGFILPLFCDRIHSRETIALILLVFCWWIATQYVSIADLELKKRILELNQSSQCGQSNPTPLQGLDLTVPIASDRTKKTVVVNLLDSLRDVIKAGQVVVHVSDTRHNVAVFNLDRTIAVHNLHAAICVAEEVAREVAKNVRKLAAPHGIDEIFLDELRQDVDSTQRRVGNMSVMLEVDGYDWIPLASTNVHKVEGGYALVLSTKPRKGR